MGFREGRFGAAEVRLEVEEVGSYEREVDVLGGGVGVPDGKGDDSSGGVRCVGISRGLFEEDDLLWKRNVLRSFFLIPSFIFAVPYDSVVAVVEGDIRVSGEWHVGYSSDVVVCR